jgi:hypothetical protein
MQMDACLFTVLLLSAGLLTAQEPVVSSEPERPATRSAKRRPRASVGTPRTGIGEASPDRAQAEARKPGRREPAPPVRETGKTPLPDMGLADYLGRPGGLYPSRSNHPPTEHLAAGLRVAGQIQPLDAEGKPDPHHGKIVMISVGMSITNMSFAGSGGPGFPAASFMGRMRIDPARNPSLVIVNGAHSMPGRRGGRAG